MIYLLCGLCVICIIVIILLGLKILSMQKAADELRTEFAARLKEDTNVGIDITCSDRRMCLLASDMDVQLKALRKEYIRYAKGNQELQDAITNISHDLRTPLTAVSGYLELMNREEKSEKVDEYLSVISGRIEILKQLTEELFRYSVLVSVNQYDSREYVNLNQALEECLAGYYGALKEGNIIPAVTLPEQIVKRQLNKAALSRVLNNVMSNAVKYSSGDLKVCLTKDAEIVFENAADSMNEIKVGRLFDRFYTVESGQESTGLGLAIAKLLTEQMGGTISAELVGGALVIRIKL